MDTNSRSRFTEHGLEKRKACDHCHLRKIRCNYQYPECTHCTTYNVRCTYTPHIRKRRKDLQVEYKTPEESGPSSPGHVHHGRPGSAITDTQLVETTIDTEAALRRNLPPPADYMIMIDDYFANINNILPLFNERRFRTMLKHWSRYPGQRDPITLASINVVLALSLQYRATTLLLPEPYRLETFVHNAQSAMNDLVSQSGDLRCVQALIGLAMLFQMKCNLQSSSVLIATAMKLAHRMRLHRKCHPDSIDDEYASERASVFWMLYILDRELSVKGREPYLHRDSDIEIELPSTIKPNDRTGVVHCAEGSWFNLFQARVHLARVQGSIYDWTCSTKAETLSLEERGRVEQWLCKALSDWQSSIPDAFRYDRLDSSLPTFIAQHLVLLHFDFFNSVFKARRVYSDDPAWVRGLMEYSDRYASGRKAPITDMGCSPESTQNAIVSIGQSPLPRDWHEIVGIARACMALFRGVDQRNEALFRATLCTYTTAMVIIIANILTFAEHETHNEFMTDNIFVSEGLEVSEKAATRSSNEKLLKIHAGFAELNRRATISAAMFFAAKA